MSDLLKRLARKEQRGSKPRCHWLTHGTVAQVAARLSNLAAPWGTVTPNDRWMPEGFQDREEAQLHQASRLLDPTIGRRLAEWWLVASTGAGRTPNWDIASTCMIDGKPGLLLIEAKAHDQELIKEETGRKNIEPPASADARRNHARIGWCIQDANIALAQETKLPWAMTRDWNYQMANRFAWSWKLAEFGIPVVLVYLGFLNADEMMDRGKPFADHRTWEVLVKAHSEPLFPEAVWNRRWSINGVPFIPHIRSLEQPLDQDVRL